MASYDHQKIEKKWKELWSAFNNNLGIYHFEDKPDQKKMFVLDMFPYPSGSGLHVGHPKGYTATDVFARYKKMKGYNVLHPIGWDAFGLPAEQYAIENKKSPKVFTQKNIDNFKHQLDNLGFCFPKNKEINTTDPNYYQWTQWIFLQMYKKGLASLKNVEVNWCPNLSTVLSNEEVVVDANNNMVSERGSHPVYKKPMQQWVLHITKYADALLAGLDDLNWPESIKEAQKKWIGKTNGIELKLKIYENLNLNILSFLQNPASLKYAQAIVISINFADWKKIVNTNLYSKVEKYIQECSQQSHKKIMHDARNMNGIFLGIHAINPLTKELIPIWMSNCVKYFSQNSIIVASAFNNENAMFAQYIGAKKYKLDADIDIILEADRTFKFLQKHKLGKEKVEYNLHDWIFSRQRYWGEPFPIYFDKNNNDFAFKETELPIILPEIQDSNLLSGMKGPLANIPSWIEFKINGTVFYRESNTMPQWAGSSWYYIAYILKENNNTYLPLDSTSAKEKLARWLPVDLYIGGQEHAVLHLLYARFWHLFLYDLGIVSHKEPFNRLFNQGMILGENGEKMSKSRGNVLNPDEIVQSLGADTLRLYEMFMGPLNATLKWSHSSLNSVSKWLDRVFNLFSRPNFVEAKNNLALNYATNYLIYHVEECIQELKYNICISDMMVFINQCYAANFIGIKQANAFLKILSCFCPHIADEIYNKINNFSEEEFLFLSKWPKADLNALKTNKIKIIVQINGKLRASLEMEKNISKDEIIEIAKKHENVKKFLLADIKKIIYVDQKLINFVI